MLIFTLIKYLLLLFLSGFLLIFSLLNGQSVEINYYFGTIGCPLPWIIFMAFVMGSLVSGLMFSLTVLKNRISHWW